MFFTNPESRNFMLHRGLQSVFLCHDGSYIVIFFLNRKLLPCKKLNKEKFVRKNSRFVDSGIVKTCEEFDLKMARTRPSRKCQSK